jgi:hypothetical protein
MLAFQEPNPLVLVTGPSGPPLEDDELDELELLDDELLDELLDEPVPLEELELVEELPGSVSKLRPRDCGETLPAASRAATANR